MSSSTDVSAIRPQGAFYVFVDISEALKLSYNGKKVGTCGEFARILIEEFDTAVIPCADFGFDDHIRLSYAINMVAIKKGLDRIETFLKHLK